MNLFTKQKQTHKLRERTYGYQEEGGGGGIDWEFVIDIYTLLYLKWNAWDFPGGTVVKNLPAHARYTGSIPGPGRSHMLRSN